MTSRYSLYSGRKHFLKFIGAHNRLIALEIQNVGLKKGINWTISKHMYSTIMLYYKPAFLNLVSFTL